MTFIGSNSSADIPPIYPHKKQCATLKALIDTTSFIDVEIISFISTHYQRLNSNLVCTASRHFKLTFIFHHDNLWKPSMISAQVHQVLEV